MSNQIKSPPTPCLKIMIYIGEKRSFRSHLAMLDQLQNVALNWRFRINLLDAPPRSIFSCNKIS
jgi:hypothetical protein